jgi:hypothetical protein
MTFAARFRVTGVVLTLCIGGSHRVAAQTGATAHDPLFGADVPVGARSSTNVTASVWRGHDDDLSVDQGIGVSPLQPHVGGEYSDLDASLSFARTRQRFSITARATSAVRHYPALNSFDGSNDSAAMNLAVGLGRKTTFRTSVAGNYVSSLALDSFLQRTPLEPAGEGITASSTGLDNAALDWTRTTYGGTAELSRALGRFSSLTFVVGTGHSQRPVAHQGSDEQSVGALFGRSIGRGVQVGVSYNFHDGVQWNGNDRFPIWSHDVQLSVEQRWQHSPFRRTAIRFSGGPSLLQQTTILGDAIVDPTTADLAAGNLTARDASGGLVLVEPVALQNEFVTRQFRVVGTLFVTHDLTRTWNLQGSYRRGSGVRDGVIFSNTATLDLRGRFGRRTSITGSAGYTDGDLGLATVENRYGTSFGAVQLQLALARSVALQGQYFRYRYDYATGAVLPPGWVPRTYRQGVRVGIVIWAPVQRG